MKTLAALTGLMLLPLLVMSAQPHDSFRERLPEDEVIYFLLPDRFENGDPRNDRGGLTGDRLRTGFDPKHKGFYHGGDLRGLTARLDYIQALGATAIWLGPIYKNKPVQGTPGRESAGYHGYWITDFTTIDPHFGTQSDMQAFVNAAHQRGMKVYLDIITNHTADVIGYRECPTGECPYRSLADYPYSNAGGVDGPAINPGFLGHHVQTRANFERLTRADFAYTPVVRDHERNLKVPQWLNDPIWYHNRGNSAFRGESLTLGDFAGLDDLMTEHPRVVEGFIEIYGHWIDRYGIDGFRIDTAKHVNPEFWQRFAPAMQAKARDNRIPNFHIFGEVWTLEADTSLLARATRVDRQPTVLDFAFRAAVLDAIVKQGATDQLTRLFAADALYEGGERTARQLPTFVSNHDSGRLAHHLRAAHPNATDEELVRRVALAHAMMFTLRGVPVLYSGDEQGFVGDGGDQDAREDLFPSQVPSYNDNDLIGTAADTSTSNFDTGHPLFRAIAELARLRQAHSALRRGTQTVLHDADAPGLFAVSRKDESTGRELLIVFNTSRDSITANIAIDPAAQAFTSVRGRCSEVPRAPGSMPITVAGLDYVVCAVNPG